MRRERLASALAAGLVAAVAFAPFLRGVFSGACLYFRDLSLYFLPLRRFALEGLAAGQIRLWNPYLHEGVPLSLPALGYPPDLLQLLRPDEFGISLSLALHVPLAALALFLLARGLGLSRPAAAGGACVYALGGFLLSTVNLYVYLQAAAWAPLAVLGLLRLADDGSVRRLAASAVVLGVALTTTAVEVVAATLLAALVLTVGSSAARAGRLLLRTCSTLALAAGLAAPVLLLLVGQVGGSARGSGFAPEVVLSHSVHPFTLVQTLVAGLYGNPANLASEWWGQNFVPRGFPYVLSLYLGAPAVSLAVVGAFGAHPLRRRLLALVGLGLLLSLGRWAGLQQLVEALSVLRLFRYPVKAFFLVHLAAALLAAMGIEALAGERHPRPWRRLAIAAGTLGLLLCGAPLLPRLFPHWMAAFAAAFLPPGYGAPARAAILQRVLADAASGGAIALALAATAGVVLAHRLTPVRASVLAAALVAADLLRAGAGLNPMVTRPFFLPSPELAARLDGLREGRVFTCDLDESPAYLAGRLRRTGGHEVWTFAALLETLTPAFNVPLAVRSALSTDLTMLVPPSRVLSPSEASCRDLDAIVPRLREAGVRTVVSLDRLSHPALARVDGYAPVRLAPLSVNVYLLSEARPLAELRDAGGSLSEKLPRPGEISLEVAAERNGLLVVREGWAPGWRARLNGRATPVVEVDGRHLGVHVPAGASAVSLEYAPRGLGPALLLSLLCTAAVALALASGRTARGRASGV